MLLFHAASEHSGEVTHLATTLDNTPYTHEDTTTLLPLLTTKQEVLFPGVIMPTNLQQEQAKYLAKEVYRTDSPIGVVAQKKPNIEKPTEQDIFHIGTIGSIMQLIMLPDGRTTAILQGQQKFQATQITQKAPYSGHTYASLAKTPTATKVKPPKP